MRNIIALFCFLFFFFFLLFTLPVTLTCAASPSKTIKETLKVGIQAFPYNLNPLYTTDETSQGIVNKVFDSLFYYDGTGKLQKGLMEDFQSRGNVIILELKRNVFFSNGHELDADDVIATIRTARDKRFFSPYMSKLAFIEKIEKTDRYGLKLVTGYNLATWKNHLTIKILDAEELNGAEPGMFRHMVLSGTGAYKFDEIDEPSRVVLSLDNTGGNNMNNLYERIEYTVVAYPRLAPLKLLNHELDICELQTENAAAYERSPGWQKEFKILRYRKFGYTYLMFNLKRENVSPNLRRLLYNVLVKGNFAEKFLEGNGERVHTPFLLLNDKLPPVPRRVEALKSPLRLRMVTNSESKTRRELVLFLRQYLKTFNVCLEPVFLEYQTFLQYLRRGDFDLAVSGFMLDIDYDLTDILHSESYFNYAGFRNREMDDLLEQGLREMDPLKREQIYRRAHDLWLKELPFLPLFNLYYHIGISNRIKIPKTASTLIGAEGDFLINITDWKTD